MPLTTDLIYILLIYTYKIIYMGFPGGSVLRIPPVSEGAARDEGSIPGWGISPGEGNGNLLQ